MMDKLIKLLGQIETNEFFEESYVRVFSDGSGALLSSNDFVIAEWDNDCDGVRKLTLLAEITKLKSI
jgi:hypothetical protein